MITITGATGHTGSAIANQLLEKGENIRLVGRSEERLEPFVRRGAEIAVGDMSDEAFLVSAFSGASTVYLLIPPKFDTTDMRSYYNQLGNVAIKAIMQSDVNNIVLLSSLGADKEAGTGPVLGLHDMENKLKTLKSVNSLALRAGYFMENLLGNIPLIKEKGINGGTLSEDTNALMVATKDIAKVASDFLVKPNFVGFSYIELFGDRITAKEMTQTIGKELDISNLPYIHFSDTDAENAFVAMGLSLNVARQFIELSHGVDNGLFLPIVAKEQQPTTPTTFLQFVKEVFKPAFNAPVEHLVV